VAVSPYWIVRNPASSDGVPLASLSSQGSLQLPQLTPKRLRTRVLFLVTKLRNLSTWWWRENYSEHDAPAHRTQSQEREPCLLPREEFLRAIACIVRLLMMLLRGAHPGKSFLGELHTWSRFHFRYQSGLLELLKTSDHAFIVIDTRLPAVPAGFLCVQGHVP
jgi:hypothetical protein